MRHVYLGSQLLRHHYHRILEELNDMHVTIFRMKIDQYDFDWPKIKGLKEKLVLDDTRDV